MESVRVWRAVWHLGERILLLRGDTQVHGGNVEVMLCLVPLTKAKGAIESAGPFQTRALIGVLVAAVGS